MQRVERSSVRMAHIPVNIQSLFSYITVCTLLWQILCISYSLVAAGSSTTALSAISNSLRETRRTTAGSAKITGTLRGVRWDQQGNHWRPQDSLWKQWEFMMFYSDPRVTTKQWKFIVLSRKPHFSWKVWFSVETMFFVKTTILKCGFPQKQRFWNVFLWETTF